MSAPTTHDPLVVNTQDGVVWQRRAVTSDGRGLYAVTGSCSCPEYLMATLAELAEHGICGSADVLPVPVGPGLSAVEFRQKVFGPEPQPLSVEHLAEIEARAGAATDGPWERYDGFGPHFFANTSGEYLQGVGDFNFGVGEQADADEEFVRHAQQDVAVLAVEVRRLLVERRTTNEALDDAVQALRVDRDRIVELERLIAEAPASYALMERARAEADEAAGECLLEGDDLKRAVRGHLFGGGS